MSPTAPRAPFVDSSRPREIEPLSNRLLIHRVSNALLPLAIRAGIHPNLVSLTGLACGLLAALAYAEWRYPLACLAGLVLMLAWHIADGLDGSLARATGKTSDFGRLVDGIADYATFVAVYLALALSLENWPLALAVAVLSGALHALQSMFYEAERATYIRRLSGRFAATPRSAAGGPIERLYNRGEAWLGNRTRPFDDHLRRAPPAHHQALLAAWASAAAPRLKALTLLSANARTVAIFLACIAGSPWLFWAYEIIGLTLLALFLGRRLRQVEQTLLQDQPRC
ncbi:CDP-alcohol phosphatidyltransferase family protein [Sandaracinobacteroides saxicola]|uniref:CDP-alcohol phosphatidyltransferase family protein n=1 Tax=Sandaracinobacteroides saxicola TaxID=2759707 RepID=A0A7G5IEP1_9SPHN|nr:CDP-alcohol phosphatidyltransferase family protein [Sandaracinobacteroides saxicola]QMW21833.1 CDP-alcohol phosphatidyltransferase family protein [Sandaracinobacteroides saxicola]